METDLALGQFDGAHGIPQMVFYQSKRPNFSLAAAHAAAETREKVGSTQPLRGPPVPLNCKNTSFQAFFIAERTILTATPSLDRGKSRLFSSNGQNRVPWYNISTLNAGLLVSM
jgi:hypothetical protein